MPLKRFVCPDGNEIPIKECLRENNCRMGSRCATRSYLRLASSDRPWKGVPSTTQLIGGTKLAFLKITQDYATSPDDRAFMIHGTKGHSVLEEATDELSLLEQKFVDENDTGIADVIEIEDGKNILVDYKTSGSYKVAKALGFKTVEEPTGKFLKSGPRKGQEKMRKILEKKDEYIERFDWELQLNNYRIKWEKENGAKIDKLKIQCVVRDGGTYIARSRGCFRNIYYFDINILDDNFVLNYFAEKKAALLQALNQGYWKHACTAEENWDGLRCQRYCDVAEYCHYGKFLKQNQSKEDQMIKGLSDVRRLPRLGKIRLGIKKKSKNGNMYPSEVDYFILSPQTPSELENNKMIEEFSKLYGDQPKQIQIMFPVANPDVFFPQDYKRYGKTTSLQCKGDGNTATCASDDFSDGLEVIEKTELGNPIVKCLGKNCSYYQAKKCTEVRILQVLLPEMPGAGVWQISTGSINSIININSCIDYIRAVCGRVHMIPLTLERRKQEIAFEGKKTNHFILHINMNFRLNELQKLATIDPEKIALELPEPKAESIDILNQENETIEPKEEEGDPSKTNLIKAWILWIDSWYSEKKTEEEKKQAREFIINKTGGQEGIKEVLKYFDDCFNQPQNT